MVSVLVGDLFISSAQTLVNTVNCVGVMGKGIALGFKQRFPDMYHDYTSRCKRGEVRLGEPYLYRPMLGKWVLNFPTKDHWRSVAKLEDIVRGLEYLVDHYREWGITSLAVPPLGCGEGQLEWAVVGPTLHRYLGQLDIPVELYAPFGTPSGELGHDFLADRHRMIHSQRRVGPGSVALALIVSKLMTDPHRRPLGRIQFQKLAYFATQAGIPTGLTFTRGSYGPYSPGLKKQVAALVNNGLVQERRLGEMIVVEPGRALRDAASAYDTSVETFAQSAERVCDLFLRMDTTRSEIAASAHFAAKSLSMSLRRMPTEREVVDFVLAWKARRRPPVKESVVTNAVRNLAALGWISVQPTADLVPDDDLDFA